jgi:FkbM family methyltransferase
MAETSFKKIMRKLIPPFIYSRLARAADHNVKRVKADWQIIKKGQLQGRQLFFSTSRGSWQESMIEGVYDQFIFEYIRQAEIEGAVIYDVGSHIGYHTLSFAHLVGVTGYVYSFEPNAYNLKYLQFNLQRNPDLAARIRVLDIAVTDQTGEADFHFSDDVEGGRSSGSFLSNADTYYPKTEAFLNSFKKNRVRISSLDELYSTGTLKLPRLIKIDVEGSEGRVVRGAVRLIKDQHPLLLIEVHSIYNMLQISEILHPLEYAITLLKEEVDGRCFIAGVPLLKAGQ